MTQEGGGESPVNKIFMWKQELGAIGAKAEMAGESGLTGKYQYFARIIYNYVDDITQVIRK
jgi:hypothetical protein